MGSLTAFILFFDAGLSVIVGHSFRNNYGAAFAVIKSQNS
jgi:hypothetical protein